jgi:hypothetical protein
VGEFIIDIDDFKSVQAVMGRVSESWFNPEETYSDLKTNGKTNSPDFWGIATNLLADVSALLGLTSERFLSEWNRRCTSCDTHIMGYHCTRHSAKQVFMKKGILPLSDETIRLSEDSPQTPLSKTMWEYRSQRSPGPWFLMSYKDAKNPNNYFCLKGPEILLAHSGHHVGVDPAKSVPLIIHCAIPYSILSEKDYFAFCILRAYFNYLDPEDDSINLFEGYSIDLRGQVLDPRYIVRIEEVE